MTLATSVSIPAPRAAPRAIDVHAGDGVRIHTWCSQDGQRFTLRPVEPRDLGLLAEMFRRTSGASRYDRFHGAVNELPLHVLRDFTHVDHRTHVALVITCGAPEGEIVVAEARYTVDVGASTGEFAVLVEDRWQRRGLGERAVRSLVEAACRAGLRRLRGDVLRTNAAMLALMKRCGFGRTAGAREARAVAFEKRLGVA
ncbi:MAG TPA: GNAT family protein [Caldimonas sp.]|nr:GNAT family protein [Caldimonas sp.]